MLQDFSGQNLSGRSFRGQNLTGANFSNADIRGANFSNAILQNANFSGVIGGLPRNWLITLILISHSLTILFTLSSISIISVIRFSISNAFFESNLILITICMALFFASIVIAAKHNLLKTIALLAVIIIASCGIIFAISNSILTEFKTELVFLVTVIGSCLTISSISIINIAFSVTAIKTLSQRYYPIVIFSALIAGFFGTIFRIIFRGGNTATLTDLIISPVWNWAWIDMIWGSIWSWSVTIIGVYIGLLSFRGHKELTLIRKAAVALSTIGSTNFYQANLQNANFEKAILKNTDFRDADFKGTWWSQAKYLHIARVGNSYLKYPVVRQLVTSGCGENRNFDRLNLQGINLKNANLNNSSFIGTDLSEANLQATELSNALLIQTQLDKADFTNATLTGAVIQDWNITVNTKFDKVRCEYVFMRLPTEDNPNPLRKPDNKIEIFAAGEFGDFIKPIVDTLDLYHNQNVDPRAIAISFKQLAENHPHAHLQIVGMEVKGQDKFLLRAKADNHIDKSSLSADYFKIYNQIKALAKQELKTLIAEKDSRIRSLETMVTTALQRPSFYVENQINITSQQDISSVAAEIQIILEKLEKQKHPITDIEKLATIALAIEEIRKNPTLEARLINALKAGGIQAFKEAVKHPLANILVATIQGWFS
ncbi:putative low-complexity protein [Rivularia sp. PCC 7116]|uniref:pentapeptide repeat-containing protein n=1 Tax=Rivularia sp. PCC 7116 TaxID=373994 RepID=UPI00029EE5A0|nr:pentapeptide repeat-containing protein [Rivularia sp. PCC 7116]AFY58731.1 putative low-complexity protein [Rivularia sp. PCC 7116]